MLRFSLSLTYQILKHTVFSVLFEALRSYSQELDICSSGACSWQYAWDDEDPSIIHVCTNTADTCSLSIQRKHQNVKVYSAAPVTTITCYGFHGCELGEYHCGDELPPNADLYNLTSANFTDTVKTCDFDCSDGDADVCLQASFFCNGNVSECRVQGSLGMSLESAALDCTDITYPNAVCSMHCPCCLSCEDSTMDCTNTMATCDATWENGKGHLPDIQTSTATSNPTTNPINPTSAPSLLPTKHESFNSTMATLSTLSTSESISTPVLFTTKYEPKISTISPLFNSTMLLTSEPSKDPNIMSAEFVTEDVARGGTLKTTEHSVKIDVLYFGINAQLFYIILGSAVFVFCVLLLLGIYYFNNKSKTKPETDDSIDIDIIRVQSHTAVDDNTAEHHDVEMGEEDDDNEDLYIPQKDENVTETVATVTVEGDTDAEEDEDEDGEEEDDDDDDDEDIDDMYKPGIPDTKSDDTDGTPQDVVIVN